MKITLRHLPSSVCTREYTSFVRVVQEGYSCVVHLITHPSRHQIEIKFLGVVGLKTLDERDFSAYWRNNIEWDDEIDGALVAQVVSGGWMQHEEMTLSHVPTGFYGDVMEFFVSSDYQCVNVLCTEQPQVRICA